MATYTLFDAPYPYAITSPTNLITTTSPFVDAANEDLRLTACTPAINAGDPASTTATSGSVDLAGNPRFYNSRIDMGAYEFQGEPNIPVTITGGPASTSAVCAGSTVSVPISATGTGPLTYQWYKDGTSLEGQTSETLSLTNVQVSQAGNYSVVVTNSCGSQTSGVFSLSVSEVLTPTLTLQAGTTQPILQNTPFVTVNITGCEGGIVNWKGSNSTSGTGTTILVPTTTATSLVYSATCTLGSCASQPGSTTVTISTPLVTGSFDGFIYGADCATFRGWAWDRSKPNTPVSVDILDGARVIETVLADVFRQDLQTAGKGNGKHAFFFPIPESLKDGIAHNLSARVAGSSFILKDSPKALVCVGTGTPENKPPVPPSPTILIAPLAAQVGVPFSGTLVAFTDPEAQPLTYKLSGLPDGLSINETSRVISGTPTEAGTFVLAYQATDAGGLTNSVSFPLTVNPASTTTVTGSFEGYLDKVECGTIRGWIWDRNKPNTPLTVEFYHDQTQQVFGSTVANIYRQDLKDAGKGNGAHAYSFTVPESLKDGVPRPIAARVLGSTYVLKGSPKVLTCPSAARLSAEAGSELEVRVLGNPVFNQLKVEIRGAAGKPLRLQLHDAQGRVIGTQQVEKAGAIEHRQFDISTQPAGLLLLNVTSYQHKHTVKVLKQ